MKLEDARLRCEQKATALVLARRHPRWLRIALLTLAAGSAMCSPAGNAASVFGNGRGIANSGGVGLKRVGGPGSTVDYEPLPERFSPHVLAQIKKAGFDNIRFMVTAEPLLTNDPVHLERAVAWISRQVDEALAARLGVVVDLHPWVGGDSPFSQDAIVLDRSKLEALMRGQVALARQLSKRAEVALELLNEPPCSAGKGSVDWPGAQHEMVTRIRKVAPNLPLVLKGCRDRIDTLVALDPRNYARDANIYWSIHYYQPSSFVEQSQKKLISVPFPPDATRSTSLSAMSRMVPAATALSNPRALIELRQYLKDGRGRATIAADFDKAVAWARRNGISQRRIWLGEWGTLIEKGPAGEAVRADNLRYLTVVREEAERRGFAWANFGIGGNHVSFDPATRFIRQDALVALGVTSRP